MNTDKTFEISTENSEETEKLGERLGSNLRGGEIIELVSDLGGGKTTLVRGIARGFGSLDKVSSPTFTVSKEYKNKDTRIVHCDFYRLQDPGILQYELAEELNDPKTVLIIEWADIVQNVLPKSRMTIRITSTGEKSRKISIEYPSTYKYLLENN